MPTPLILTDANGRPIPRPSRVDFATTADYLRAAWAFQDAVYAAGNEGFAKGFARGMRAR